MIGACKLRTLEIVGWAVYSDVRHVYGNNGYMARVSRMTSVNKVPSLSYSKTKLYFWPLIDTKQYKTGANMPGYIHTSDRKNIQGEKA